MKTFKWPQNARIYILFTTRPILGNRTVGRMGALEEAGGAEQHNTTEAAPNELKIGEGS